MRVLGVMAGNGVIIHPLKEYLIGNIEPRAIFHSKNNSQWKINFNEIPYKTSYNEDLIHWRKRGVDVIIGNPDCGHSSILSYSRSKKLSNPNDNKSIALYLMSIKLIKPKIFMMENLPKLMDIYDEKFWYNNFPDYSFIFHKCSVSNFGNSQKDRIRLLVIGLDKTYFGTYLDKIQYHFLHVYKIHTLKKSGELIKDLDGVSLNMGHIRENINNIITLYAGFKITLKQVQDFWLKNPTLKRYKVSGRNFDNAPGVYRNLEFDYPSTARKANRQFNHLGLQMSPRELARIQGVPDSFNIYFEPNKIGYWINKGRATVTKCPPYEVGEWFKRQLLKIDEIWKL